MSSSLRRGRTLDPHAVAMARRWKEQRIEHLKSEVRAGTATLKERRELRWKWGIVLEEV